jgi:hypothetical protein
MTQLVVPGESAELHRWVLCWLPAEREVLPAGWLPAGLPVRAGMVCLLVALALLRR